MTIILDLDPSNDPFLSSDAKEGKPTASSNRQNSFDEPTGSESEAVSPRHQQQQKNRKSRGGRQRKGSVEPTIPEGGDETGATNKTGL